MTISFSTRWLADLRPLISERAAFVRDVAWFNTFNNVLYPSSNVRVSRIFIVFRTAQDTRKIYVKVVANRRIRKMSCTMTQTVVDSKMKTTHTHADLESHFVAVLRRYDDENDLHRWVSAYNRVWFAYLSADADVQVLQHELGTCLWMHVHIVYHSDRRSVLYIPCCIILCRGARTRTNSNCQRTTTRWRHFNGNLYWFRRLMWGAHIATDNMEMVSRRRFDLELNYLLTPDDSSFTYKQWISSQGDILFNSHVHTCNSNVAKPIGCCVWILCDNNSSSVCALYLLSFIDSVESTAFVSE